MKSQYSSHPNDYPKIRNVSYGPHSMANHGLPNSVQCNSIQKVFIVPHKLSKETSMIQNIINSWMKTVKYHKIGDVHDHNFPHKDMEHISRNVDRILFYFVLFCCYLYNRHQRVTLGNMGSEWSAVTKCVPQGSIHCLMYSRNPL